MLEKRVSHLALKDLIAVGLRDGDISRVEADANHCGSRNGDFASEMFGQSKHPAARCDCLGCVERYDLLLGVNAGVRSTRLSDKRRMWIHFDNRPLQFARDGSLIGLLSHAMKVSPVVRNPQQYAIPIFAGHVCVIPRASVTVAAG